MNTPKKQQPTAIKAVATAILHDGNVIQICADSYPIIRGHVGNKAHWPPRQCAIIIGPEIEGVKVPAKSRFVTLFRRIMAALKP